MLDAVIRFALRSRLLVLVGSLALLGVAYSLPTVTYLRLGRGPETFSIYGGAEVLWTDGNPILAAIVFGFSIVFPLAKLSLLAGLLSGRLGGGHPGSMANGLLPYGKWSMVDVFLVGLLDARGL